MKNYHSFDFLKKIYFERTGGSVNELKAANLIKEEVESLGEKAYLETFMVDDAKINNCKLSFLNPSFSIECKGSGYSGSTPVGGIKAEFIYISSDVDLEMNNLKDKIVLFIQKRCSHKFYMKALRDGAKGIIVTTGSVYKNAKDVDLDPYLNREPDYKEGKIPTVMIRMKDAEKLVEKMPKYAILDLQSEELKSESRNVVSTILGTEYPDEIITFTAHYDSVLYSKGIYDNATGAITLLQMVDFYHKNPPKRTIKFIWCGSEEMGLLGSKAYCATHKDEINEKVILNVNIDMVAVTLGFDYACVTGEQAIIENIVYASKELGFPIVVKQGVYSSDSTPFADCGVPAISFARLAPNGGAVIHSHDDVIERLSERNYINTCNFISFISSRWINSKKFPIRKFMPDNMKEEIDYYLLRKERPEK